MMIFDSDSSILVLFCRRPALGIGKQRIATDLGEEAALQAGILLLEAALEDLRNWSGPVVIAPASDADIPWAAQLLPSASIIAQSEGNLGQRIQAVESQIRESGGRRIIFIGSDAPSLTSENIATAFAQLESHDVALIPARDGGVTLMGSSKPWPNLVNLPWGTSRLGEALQKICIENSLQVASLTSGYDIDTREDLLLALKLLASEQRPARIKLRDWIKSLDLGNTQTQAEVSISAIIPVLGDHQALEALLKKLGNCGDGMEVIVVDAANHETCKSICKETGALHVASEPNRGSQLRQGARLAKGSILWFLHADCEPPPSAASLIHAHIAAGHNGGYFRFCFAGINHWRKRLLQTAINARARLGVPYGDQGLFATRAAYKAAGEHAPTPLFEEVSLVKQLRRTGRFRSVAADIQVSERRWQRDGWLKRSLHNRYLAIAFALGVSPERLARQYGHRNGTGQEAVTD